VVARARRLAEEFAALVDGQTSAQEQRYRELLTVVDALRATEVHRAAREYVTDLRAALLGTPEAVLRPVDERLTPRPAALRWVLRVGRFRADPRHRRG